MLLSVSTFNAQILLRNAKYTLFKLWKINAMLLYVLFLVWMVGINPYSNFYLKILGYLRLLEVEEREERSIDNLTLLCYLRFEESFSFILRE